jgi:DNA mismatch repair protein MutS2
MQSDLNTLEFSAIRRSLEADCATPYGKEAARNLEPAPSLEVARAFQGAVSTAREACDTGDAPKLGEVPDVRAALRQASQNGASPLNGMALRNLITVMQTGEYLARALEKRPGLYVGNAADLTAPSPLIDRFDATVDTMGRVRPEASEELARLHGEIQSVRADLDKEVAKKQKDKKLAPHLVEPKTEHYSGPRRVLAVKHEAVGNIKGARREALSRGRGVMVEPMEWIPLNNRLEQLAKEVDAEERRVLKEATGTVAENGAALQQLLDAVTWLDLALGAGRLSVRIEGVPPELAEEPQLELRDARHPALVAEYKNGGPVPVPLSVSLTADSPMVLITGPNTGGKTVAIKTIGLLATMAFCGLHIPAAEGTVVGGYRRILVDIGDHQSILHHVSTFAGHVEILKQILAAADERTLVLMDEMGTGTDPEEGAALAMSVLEELAERGVQGVFTTHLSPLKGFADNHRAIRNANMRFDFERLAPTYQLSVGEAGASLGLVVAERNGLEEPLLSRARAHLEELRPGATTEASKPG